jgi:hypothetical protein
VLTAERCPLFSGGFTISAINLFFFTDTVKYEMAEHPEGRDMASRRQCDGAFS